ncbi:MAG: flagellar motor protein MotB [Anaerolineaceae bacterium]|nr:flagellar motor protein MotB [Anaerolineaceae bacterium]
MSRRTGHAEAEGEGSSERWLVSYSDFITLLMVMFVVLYSMGQVDVKKYKLLSDSFKAAFTLGGAVQVVDSKIDQQGGTQQDGQPNPIQVPGIPQKPPESAQVAGELTAMLASSGLGSGVSVKTNIEGVLIAISEHLVYAPGSADLQAEAYPVLDTIIKMLLQINNSFRITGHTDNTPPKDSRYKDNWELSVARANVIAEYLVSHGVSPTRLTIAGRGEYEPIFPNDTEEHRALNSRSEIVIVYPVDTNKMGIDDNHLDTPGQ